jgi:hypothetical protein
MRAAMENGSLRHLGRARREPTSTRPTSQHARPDAERRHVVAVLALPFLDVAGIRRAASCIALDACHGAAAVILAG